MSRREFWRILRRLLEEKVTIFVSTAYLDEADRCDRVGLIDHGRLMACGAPAEIKKLMRGQIVEIRMEEPRRAVALLRERLPGATVGLFGDRLHVVGDDAERTAAAARAALDAAGMPAMNFRRIEPSLEDVFISVLREKDDLAQSRKDAKEEEKNA